MRKNQNIQKSALFDDSISCIDTTSNDSNIIHKKTITPDFYNSIKTSKDNIKNRLKD